MKVGETIAQGDILLMKVEKVNRALNQFPNIPPSSPGKNVIALGEATGHMHYVDAAVSLMYQGFEPRPGENSTPGVYGQFIEVQQPTQLRHGGLDGSFDHNPIDLEPGFYRIIRQREYNALNPRVVGD